MGTERYACSVKAFFHFCSSYSLYINVGLISPLNSYMFFNYQEQSRFFFTFRYCVIILCVLHSSVWLLLEEQMSNDKLVLFSLWHLNENSPRCSVVIEQYCPSHPWQHNTYYTYCVTESGVRCSPYHFRSLTS